jgi:ATP-dependent DNA helicase RecQ
VDARVRGELALRRCLGSDATFREGQWEAIEDVALRHQRVLVVQKTGWGKSLVYFIATKLLRDCDSGPTLIVSPLLALMRDQVRMAENLGIRSATLNSANSDEWAAIEDQLRRDELDVLLVSPERLGNDRFVRQTLPTMRAGVGLLVIDEAHCISDWGHDFRPDYRRIVGIVRQLAPTIPVLATTATANNRVVADVSLQIGESVAVLRGPLTRDSLRLQAIRLDTHAERLAWLAEHIPKLRRAGIIYVQTVRDAQQVSEWLELQSFDAPAYYGSLGDDARQDIEARLLGNKLDAVVATTALGMGFDKPDLGFVIHYQRPGSIVAYYQQIGRAGRAIPDAHAVLLYGLGDDDIQDFFIDSAFPAEATLFDIVESLEEAESLSTRELGAMVNAPYRRIEQALKLLELDGAVTRDGSRYSRSVNRWQPDRQRTAQVTAQRRYEMDQMRAYTETDECLMLFIARELDDAHAAPCGRCATCVGAALPDQPGSALVQRAQRFLRQAVAPITPRKQLPAGVYPDRPNRSLDSERRNAVGRALAVWGDDGWSNMVRAGKYTSGRFDDALVNAAVRLIRERWIPDPPPQWVAAVPSQRHPDLVPEFAHRLAVSLDLPYRDVLHKRHETREQKDMQNSAQQLLNIVDAIAVRRDQVLSGPVLLVDDIVDSGWTLTVCGAWLRRAGSGPVYPFALAAMPPGRDPG